MTPSASRRPSSRTGISLFCRDSERAKEETATREEILGRLEQILENTCASEAHTQKACDLMATPDYKRFLRKLGSGGLRI